MKRIRLKDANVDICVTLDVKTIFMHKPSGRIEEELERLELSRAVSHIGLRHEDALAKEIAREAKKLFRAQQDGASD